MRLNRVLQNYKNNILKIQRKSNKTKNSKYLLTSKSLVRSNNISLNTLFGFDNMSDIIDAINASIEEFAAAREISKERLQTASAEYFNILSNSEAADFSDLPAAMREIAQSAEEIGAYNEEIETYLFLERYAIAVENDPSLDIVNVDIDGTLQTISFFIGGELDISDIDDETLSAVLTQTNSRHSYAE